MLTVNSMSLDIAEKVREFFTAYPLHTYRKQAILLHPDEPLSGIFYIVEGRVSEYDITPNGKEVVVNVFKPGAFFPMSTALNHSPNLYHFEASTVVKAHVVPPEAAVQFLQDNPDVTLDLLTRVYRGVDGVLRRMAHLMGGDAESRLIFEILNAVNRFGEVRPDGSVAIPLTESDIARHSGMVRETVNRNIQTLKTKGLLDVSHSGMVIKDVRQLESLLGTRL